MAFKELLKTSFAFQEGSFLLRTYIFINKNVNIKLFLPAAENNFIQLYGQGSGGIGLTS